MENHSTGLPEWQQRLLDERNELREKLIKLLNALSSKDFKVSCEEWRMLEEQSSAMRRYYDSLTRRCEYYNLIDNERELICY